MKLLGMSVFVLVGILCGLFVDRILNRYSKGKALNVVMGIIGAFSGLYIKDFTEIQIIGNFTDAIMFSFLGALIVTFMLNLIFRR